MNTDNPDYEMAVENNYLVRWGRTGEVRPLKWWHGEGGLLDYTNPAAVEWWHSRMDQVSYTPKSMQKVEYYFRLFAQILQRTKSRSVLFTPAVTHDD